MDKGYNRTKEMKKAKVEACGTKEPGLHPVVKKPPRPLQPSDRRVILEQLCLIHHIPPKDSVFLADFWESSGHIKKVEEKYGHKLKYLEDWSGFTEYNRLWQETRQNFVKSHYKGK